MLTISRYLRGSGAAVCDRWRSNALWAACFLTVCAVAVVLYSSGFRFPWTFDDEQNLRGLSAVRDFRSAVAFVIGNEIVGNFGRPLAMASFLVNVNDWPDHPEGFRRINVTLHVFNAFLVAWAAVKCARFVPSLVSRAIPFGMTLASIWVLHPLLVSTSLMVVQRMTVLAGTFSFLGLIAYLHGRSFLSKASLQAYLWMSGGLLLGSLLGVLAKETAALLPVLTGVLEWTVLSVFAPTRARFWKLWRGVFFGGAAFCLVAYFAWRWPGILEVYKTRPFTLSERIVSEAVILFVYLRQIVWPDIAMLGPFQDDTSRILESGNWVGLSACLAWVLLAIVAVAWRRRFPALTFGVFFFIVGQLLESTVVPLELYYEHRNYIPSLGPLAAVVGTAWAADSRWPRWAVATLIFPAAWALWLTTATWGRPDAAAERWASAHPTSVRAAQNLAAAYTRQRNFAGAAATIEATFRLNPDDSTLAMQHLLMQCMVADRATYAEAVARVTAELPRLRFTKELLPTLEKWLMLQETGRCSVTTVDEQLRFLEDLSKAPSIGKHPESRIGLLALRSRVQVHAGQREIGLQSIRQAFDLSPTRQTADRLVVWLKKYASRQEVGRFQDYATSRIRPSKPSPPNPPR